HRFAALTGANRDLWPNAGRYVLVSAQIIARRMLEQETAQIPLHGDLHHDNVLFSPRSFVAIHPKGVIGDPAYDVANCFINPMGDTALCIRAERIALLADTFSARLGFDKARVLGFAAAHAALSAC